MLVCLAGEHCYQEDTDGDQDEPEYPVSGGDVLGKDVVEAMDGGDGGIFLQCPWHCFTSMLPWHFSTTDLPRPD